MTRPFPVRDFDQRRFTLDLLGAEQPPALQGISLGVGEVDHPALRVARFQQIEGKRAVEIDRSLVGHADRQPTASHLAPEDRAGGVEIGRLQLLQDFLDGEVEGLDGEEAGVFEANERPAAFDELPDRRDSLRAEAADVGRFGLARPIAVADCLREDRRQDDRPEPLDEVPGTKVGVVDRRILEVELFEDEPGPPLVHVWNPGLVKGDAGLD